MIKPTPSQSELKEALNYNAETGILSWRERPSGMNGAFNDKHAGKEALGYIRSNGYKYGTFRGKSYRAHRVIWKMMTGDEPEFIDHINGDRADNRWENLRSVTRSENSRNVKRPETNSSGAIGVYWRPEVEKWQAKIKQNRKNYCLGFYDNFDDAVAARKNGEKLLGFHKNHGRD